MSKLPMFDAIISYQSWEESVSDEAAVRYDGLVWQNYKRKFLVYI